MYSEIWNTVSHPGKKSVILIAEINFFNYSFLSKLLVYKLLLFSVQFQSIMKLTRKFNLSSA